MCTEFAYVLCVQIDGNEACVKREVRESGENAMIWVWRFWEFLLKVHLKINVYVYFLVMYKCICTCTNSYMNREHLLVYNKIFNETLMLVFYRIWIIEKREKVITKQVIASKNMDAQFEHLCRICAANTKCRNNSVVESVFIFKTLGLKDKITRHLYLNVSKICICTCTSIS